jgi:asparagine synthase (glutamine-hydrolysing)
MCGIAGFAGMRLDGEGARTRLIAMCDAIRHRGPDSDGYFLSAPVAMGMRRLSIIDVAGGQQPIANEDGTITVVFNGEIYNHHALRRELERAGHRFATRSDTEVLVHLYEQHGPEMVRRLHGMFAFSIWDARAQRLFIARDRTGMKPLSYALRGGGIVYGSELRSLYAFDRASLHVSPSAVMEYLAWGYVPDPSSIFEGVRKLPPAHYLIWSPKGELAIRRYWSPPLTQDPKVDEQELVEMIRHKLDAAVASHLESEVPLGAFLSGGLDSSTVVALMSRHASGRVKTFSIGFKEAKYDESAAARAVAAEFGTEHTELVVSPDVEQMFESIAGMFDEPFADSSAIATFLVAELARHTVTVALSGDGGDELFGGYTRYSDALRRIGAQGSDMNRWIAALGLKLPHVFPGRNRLVDVGRSDVGRYAATVVQPVRLDEGGVASARFAQGRIPIDEQLKNRFPTELSDDFAAAMMRVDLETYLVGDILTKVDRTSMAVSLEARVPLLDFELVDFAMSLPGQLRVTAAESKRLFRRAIKGIVPDFVLSRPKQGFEVPLGAWFRGPLRHRIQALRTSSAAIEPYVDRRAVERLVGEHSVGRRDHSTLLWRLIVLENWLAAAGDGRLGRPPQVPGVPASAAKTVLPNVSTVRSASPASVSSPFLHSDSSAAPLRVGIIVDEGGIPAYAHAIIEDLKRASYVKLLLCVSVTRPPNAQFTDRSGSMAFRAFTAYIESRYQAVADPLAREDGEELLSGIARVRLTCGEGVSSAPVPATVVDEVAQADLDVLVDFGSRATRGALLRLPRRGVWRYHFGDRRRYPVGSGYLTELVDGNPLSGIELTQLGETAERDLTLSRTLFSTAPFLSRVTNRFGPLWGARHVVIQSLWELHRGSLKSPEPVALGEHQSQQRLPGNLQMTRWIVREAGQRMWMRRRNSNHPLLWRIALRRSQVPLFEDAFPRATAAFRWLDAEASDSWADPVLFVRDGRTWLFFEHLIEAGRTAQISCGCLESDGMLADVRPVLRRSHHLSYPQIIEADGEVYMLPEGAQGGGLDLYRAHHFPDEWVLETRLLDFRCVDSSIFRYGDSWWMLTSPQVVPGHAPITWLLRSERLTGPWRFHPGGNVAADVSVARGAGAPFTYNGRLIRPSQDCSRAYGRALLFNEVETLGEAPYRERTIYRVEGGWLPKLEGVHSYTRAGEWEAIDGGFRR